MCPNMKRRRDWIIAIRLGCLVMAPFNFFTSLFDVRLYFYKILSKEIYWCCCWSCVLEADCCSLWFLCVCQRAQHVIHPVFVSDKAKLTSTDSHKGCVIPLTSNDDNIVLPAMSAVGFSQFSFSLLEGNGNVRLSLKSVLRLLTYFVSYQ